MENDITDIGKVAITPQKDYKENATYEWLDVVTYYGASYMCISEDGCTGITPTNTEYWQLLADKGRFTEEDKEAFKQAVVEESKTTINEHTETKKTELDNYTTEQKTSLKNELDTYEEEKETELNTHKATLETEMTNTKDNLVQEIETAQNGFDENATLKKIAFNNNVTEQTNTFNSNAEAKTADFNSNASTKQTEYDNNATAKLEEYNSNATAKVNEFNENAESYEKRIADLEQERDEIAEQMPWNTTDIAESIHIEDSAKYSRNKLDVFGNLKQETREGYNLIDTSAQLDITVNGITKKNNKDGSITLTGTSTEETRIELRSGILEEGKYTYKCFNNLINCVTNIYYVGDVTGEDIKVFTVPANSTSNYRFMYVIPTGTTINVTIKPMLVKGEYTSDTFPNFEQYGAMPSLDYPSMPVVATGVQKIRRCGKNLFDYDNANFRRAYLTASGSTWMSTISLMDINYISIPKGFSKICVRWDFGDLASSTTGCMISQYNKEKVHISRIFNQKLGSTNFYVANLNSECAFIRFSFYNTDAEIDLSNIDKYFKNISVIVSNTVANTDAVAPEYEQYKGEDITLDLEDTELCKITDADGNVVAQDRAVYRLQEDGMYKWQWEKYIKKIVFDGTENLIQNTNWNTAYPEIFHAFINFSDWKVGQKNAVLDKLKFYGYTNYTDYANKECCVCHTSNTELYLFIKADRLETFDIAGLKKFLAENNLTIWYELAESVYEDCTESQSEALDKLHKLSLAKGTNNIFVESENGVTTELQLEYMQDNNLKKEQKNKALEDRITAIENLLSTTETSALLLDNMQTDLESEVE